jgi:hypothetical protein
MSRRPKQEGIPSIKIRQYPRRHKALRVSGTVLVVVLVFTLGITAIASGLPGWANYWGGFVYAPFAVVIGGLGCLAAWRLLRSNNVARENTSRIKAQRRRAKRR